jgi:biopolymer transport protein ExbD
MKVPTTTGRGDLGINMTPMIDVVFQLIIFFLVSGHLVKQETQMPLPLPTARSASEQADGDKPRLTINVLRDGQLLIAGRTTSSADLALDLQDRLAKHGKDLEVRVRCDRAVAYEHVEPVMLACAKQGLWNVTFAVVRKEGAH